MKKYFKFLINMIAVFTGIYHQRFLFYNKLSITYTIEIGVDILFTNIEKNINLNKILNNTK
jgi:hypothetical protein